MNHSKIAFTGPFGDVNFGDYGMVINNIYDFNIKNVVMFTYNLDFSNFIKEEYLREFQIETVAVEIDNIKGGGEYAYTPLELISLTNNIKDIRKSLEGVKLLVVNGGGYFNGLWSMPHRIDKLIKIMIPALVASEMNIPILFTGNSYGPFGEHSEFFASFFSSLKNVTFATRDKLYSQMWFNQLGIKERLTFIPDDLLIVNANVLDEKNKLQVANKKYIVIETYLPIDYLEKNIKLFSKFNDYVKNVLGYKIVFLPLNLQHGGVDQGLFLEKKLNNLEFVNITDTGYLPIQDAVSIIKNAKLVISSRYHALVLALANKTPAISVLKEVMEDNRYYYNKNSGVIRQIFAGLSINEDFFMKEDYIKGLEFMIKNYDEIIDYQTNYFESEEYEENMKKLNEKRQGYISDAIKESGL